MRRQERKRATAAAAAAATAAAIVGDREAAAASSRKLVHLTAHSTAAACCRLTEIVALVCRRREVDFWSAKFIKLLKQTNIAFSKFVEQRALTSENVPSVTHQM